MAEARFVQLEGLDSPCLLVCAEGAMPEELVVDYQEESDETPKRGSVVYRLKPSSAEMPHPVYVEVFDE